MTGLNSLCDGIIQTSRVPKRVDLNATPAEVPSAMPDLKITKR